MTQFEYLRNLVYNKLFELKTNGQLRGEVEGNFAIKSYELMADKEREIVTLDEFNHTPMEIANWLTKYFKYKHRASYIALVENNTKGWETIIKLKQEYKAKGKYLRLRGRGSNRKARVEAMGKTLNHCNDLPLQVSERIAVYVR